MRTTFILACLLMLSGCTAMVVGGSGSGAYQHGKDDRSPSVVTSDSSITTQIKNEYVADSLVSVFNIGVRTYKATVTLTGTVGTIAARNQAESIARGADGVKAVNNQIVIEDRSK